MGHFKDFWYVYTQNPLWVISRQGPTLNDPGINSTGIEREFLTRVFIFCDIYSDPKGCYMYHKK